MVRLNRIYTRTGDDGTTGLVDGTRVRKDDPRVEACGAVDELNAVIGLAVGVATSEEPSLVELLRRIQNDLFDLGADLATPSEGAALRLTPQQVRFLENEIDRCNETLAPLESFVLPGGSRLAGWLHVARTFCRRAERRGVALAAKAAINPPALHYLNRLSDLLFVLARCANDDGSADILWRPAEHAGPGGEGEADVPSDPASPDVRSDPPPSGDAGGGAS